MNVEFEETLNLRSKDFEKNKKESDERKKNSWMRTKDLLKRKLT